MCRTPESHRGEATGQLAEKGKFRGNRRESTHRHRCIGRSAFFIPRTLTAATDTANNDAATRATEGAPDSDAEAVEFGRYAFARYIVQADHYMGLWEEWTKALLFLMRKQWLKFNTAKRRYEMDTDVPAWRQQPVNPLVYAIYRSAIAKLIKQRPVSEVVAPSNDSEDLESAKLGEGVLHHLYRVLKRQTKNKRYLGWLLCTGNGAARVFWNPELGRVLPLTVPVEVPDPEGEEGAVTEVECPCDEKGEPYLLPDGTPDLKHAPITQAEGDVDLVIENMLAIRWDPDAESLEDATECFIARVWPKQKVLDDLGLSEAQLDGTKDDELEAYLNLHSAAAAGADDILGVSLGSSQEEAKGQVFLVLEYFRKQCDGYPEGRHWTQVGKVIVGEEEPLPEGFWPPVVMAQDTPIPGQLHAIGLIPQCVPINEQYNYLDGKILEHGVTMAMGGIWFVHPADKGMVISTDPGQVKVSKGLAEGHPPVQAKMLPLPNEMYEERNRKLDLLQFIAGTNDIGVGQKPEGVSSGRGFLVLQEVVDSLLMPTLLAFEEASEEIDRRCLLLVQRHYRDERTIKIKGEQGKWQIRSFKGSDLVEGLDVRVQTGSSFPWSKSAKMDTALSLLEKLPALGLNNEGQIDPVRIQKILDVGGMGVFQSEGDPDAQEIDREHGMFEAFNPEKGSMQLPQLGFWQAHPVHLERHYDFIKQSYMRITRWHPAAQQAFLDHVLQTAKAVQQMIEQMAPPPDAGAGDPATNGGAPSGGGGKSGVAKKGGSSIKKTDLKVTRGDRAAAGQ